MNNTKTNKMSTNSLVFCAVMTAIVVILQFMGSFVKFGPFSISLVLIPIVIGAATCGAGAGAWLATGGLARFLIPHCRHEIIYDEEILLKGLWLLHKMN